MWKYKIQYSSKSSKHLEKQGHHDLGVSKNGDFPPHMMAVWHGKMIILQEKPVCLDTMTTTRFPKCSDTTTIWEVLKIKHRTMTKMKSSKFKQTNSWFSLQGPINSPSSGFPTGKIRQIIDSANVNVPILPTWHHPSIGIYYITIGDIIFSKSRFRNNIQIDIQLNIHWYPNNIHSYPLIYINTQLSSVFFGVLGSYTLT